MANMQLSKMSVLVVFFLRLRFALSQGWVPWSQWNDCSVMTGTGWQVRIRWCQNQPACIGDASEFRPCTDNSGGNVLSPFGSVNDWSLWGECIAPVTEHCGNGFRMRFRRECDSLNCRNIANQTESCVDQPCKVDGVWSSWTIWTSCDVTCGIGRRSHTRTCNKPVPSSGGRTCDGPSSDWAYCNTQYCPVPGEFESWSSWSGCGLPCKKGESVRETLCVSPQYGGSDCIGNARESRSCFTSQPLSSCSRMLRANVNFKITNMEYTDSLGIIHSSAYDQMKQALQGNIVTEMAKVEVSGIQFSGFEFRQGSIQTSFTIEFPNTVGIELILFQSLLDESAAIANWVIGSPSISPMFTTPSTSNKPVLTAISSTQVLCSWPYDFVNNPQVQGFVIFYKPWIDGFESWQYRVTDRNNSRFLIGYLREFTTYTVRVAAYTSNSVGLASQYEDVKTWEGVPSVEPQYLMCQSTVSDELLLSWAGPDVHLWNGFQRLYTVRYKPFLTSSWTYISIHECETSLHLTGLSAMVFYDAQVAAETNAGRGPYAWTQCQTISKYLLLPPLNLRTASQNSPYTVSVQWDAINVSGIGTSLLGYHVVFGITKIGELSFSYPPLTTHTVGPYTTFVEVQGLQQNSEISVSVLGFNERGNGPSTLAYFAGNCQCRYDFYVSWYAHTMLVQQGLGTTPHGPLVDYVRKMLGFICRTCYSYGSRTLNNGTSFPRVHFDRTKTGFFADLPNEHVMMNSVSPHAHIFMPIQEHFEVDVFQGYYKFVPVVKSSSIVFLVRKTNAAAQAIQMLGAVFNLWPMVFVIMLTSYLTGIVIMLLDRIDNPEFRRSNVILASFEGFWCAFATMTTVGYGDRTPRGVCARIVTITWTYAGLVMIAILVGGLSTAVTVISTEENTIHGSKIAALNASYEQEYVKGKNGYLPENLVYTTVPSMLSDLVDGDVDGVVIDEITLISFKSKIETMNIKVSDMYAKPFGYGIILAAETLLIEDAIRSYANEFPLEVESIEYVPTNSGSNQLGIVVMVTSGLPYFCVALLIVGLIAFGVELLIKRFRKVKPPRSKADIKLDEMVCLGEIIADFNENVRHAVHRLDHKQAMNRYSCLVRKRCPHYIEGAEKKEHYSNIVYGPSLYEQYRDKVYSEFGPAAAVRPSRY